ncbi:MAG: hypothetical protein M1554_02460 [Patescibacteria group bacterium]|jgi:hypothetical protein|nr:hypothetical protein [Patescibacteria group bacterium]
MNIQEIILIGILLSPIILISILEVNSVIAYFSVCIGAVLSTNLNNNPIVQKLYNNARYIHNYSYLNNLKLLLLIIPFIVVAVLMIKTAKGGFLSFNILGAIATGVLMAFLAEPFLPGSLTLALSHTKIWVDVFKQESNAIGISALLILILVVLQRSKFSHKSILRSKK